MSAGREFKGYHKPFESDTPDKQVRCADCKEPVTLTGFAQDCAASLASYVTRRGWAPLRDDELTRCRKCGDAWMEQRRIQGIKLDQAVGKLTREVKEGRDVDEEQLEWLRNHGYSLAAEGIEAIMRRRRDGADKKPVRQRSAV